MVAAQLGGLWGDWVNYKPSVMAMLTWLRLQRHFDKALGVSAAMQLPSVVAITNNEVYEVG